MGRIYLTPEGYNKLQLEIKELKHELKVEIAPQIGQARELGDLRENAEYDAIKRYQEEVNNKLQVRLMKLSQAEVIKTDDLDADSVTIGKRVTFTDMDMDEQESYIILGDGESDADNDIISYQSPIAKGMMGHKVGDTVSIELPRTTLKCRIDKIEIYTG